MRVFLFIGLLCWMFGLPAELLAQSGNNPVYATKWTVKLSDKDQYLVNCIDKKRTFKKNCSKLTPKQMTRAIALKKQTKWIETEVIEIVKWMGSTQNYPQGDHRKLTNHGEIIFKTAEKMNTRFGRSKDKKHADLGEDEEVVRAGEYSKWYGMINVSEDYFLPGNFDEQYASETLAHEVFHSVQFGQKEFKYAPEWVSEGLAEAVTFAWLEHKWLKGKPLKLERAYNDLKPVYSSWLKTEKDCFPKKDKIKQPEPKSICSPSLESPSTAYDRAHFFYYMGLHFEDKMKFAGEIIKTKMMTSFTPNGIYWLDRYLRERSQKLINASEEEKNAAAAKAMENHDDYLDDYYAGFLAKLTQEYYLEGSTHYKDLEKFQEMLGGCKEINLSGEKKFQEVSFTFERVSPVCLIIRPPKRSSSEQRFTGLIALESSEVAKFNHLMKVSAAKGTKISSAGIGLLDQILRYASWTFELESNGEPEIVIVSFVNTFFEDATDQKQTLSGLIAVSDISLKADFN